MATKLGGAEAVNSGLDVLRHRLADVTGSEEYRVQSVISDITEDMVARMDALGLGRSEMADRLGVSPAMVTKLLRGQNNFTVRTLVQVSDALGCRVTVKLPPCGLRVVPYFISEDTPGTGGFVAGARSSSAVRVELPDESDVGNDWVAIGDVA